MSVSYTGKSFSPASNIQYIIFCKVSTERQVQTVVDKLFSLILSHKKDTDGLPFTEMQRYRMMRYDLLYDMLLLIGKHIRTQAELTDFNRVFDALYPHFDSKTRAVCWRVLFDEDDAFRDCVPTGQQMFPVKLEIDWNGRAEDGILYYPYDNWGNEYFKVFFGCVLDPAVQQFVHDYEPYFAEEIMKPAKK